MFKIDSYIAPIILRFVDKYIQNFRPQDSQVSLWGGAATFNNLDLRLDVLERELQIPFCFVSGHIHELQIRVPWTKITTEPIVITINTIECVLKLRGSGSTPEPPPKPKPPKEEDVEPVPTSYVESIINKIVNNIEINCNNLILKYVEEDIVLSMNVKLLTFQSANVMWKPEYTEFSSSRITLRKLITLSDLTVCIDKRNASGKIDVYQEPILYKCFIEMHLLRSYHTATAKKASTTRLDVYCKKMEFSITEQQVPMVVRILLLLVALQQHELKYTSVQASGSDADSGRSPYASDDQNESWVGWAWSFVPALPLSWDEELAEDQLEIKGHTLHIGGYIDTALITFKVSEASTDHSGYFNQKKIKCTPMLHVRLQGCYMDTVMHGLKWFNARGGISEVLLLPVGPCTCSFNEIGGDVVDGSVYYLKIGRETDTNKKQSLFDSDSVENRCLRRSYNVSWDSHNDAYTETVLLQKTPALALDYLYQLEIPDDYNNDNFSDIGNNLEYSNLVEKAVCRMFVSPFTLQLSSGFFHRMNSLKQAAATYDYAPYATQKTDPDIKDLHPPSEEDFDALSVFIPIREYNLTVRTPVIEFHLMDHPYFQPKKGYLYRKRKKLSVPSAAASKSNNDVSDLPKVTLECATLRMRCTQPMYPKRLVYTTCQLPVPPLNMFEACHTYVDVQLSDLSSRLIINRTKQTTLVMPCNVKHRRKRILIPQYWSDPDIRHVTLTVETDCLTVTGTKAQMLLAQRIVDSVAKRVDTESVLSSSTIVADAIKPYGMIYLEFCIEAVRFGRVTSSTTVTNTCSALSMRAFVIEPPECKYKEPLQVLILCGPESKTNDDDDEDDASTTANLLFSALFQYPRDARNIVHAPIVYFKVSEIKICVDPLLCRWLLYVPKRTSSSRFDGYRTESVPMKHRTVSEASGSVPEIPRRIGGTPHESIHSSSDPMYAATASLRPNSNDTDVKVDFQEWIYNYLMDWILVWRVLLIDGRINKCIIYFPLTSLSAVGSRGIEEAIESAVDKDPNAEFMVVHLPKAIISSNNAHNSSQTQRVARFLNNVPIVVPETMWTVGVFSFPWTISITDFCCFTLQRGKRFNFLDPIAMKATIVLARQVAPKAKTYETKGVVNESSERKKNVQFNERVIFDRPSNESQLCGPTLGICVHIETSNTCITMSEVQVCVIVSVLYGLIDVTTNLFASSDRNDRRSVRTTETASVLSVEQSPAAYRDGTIDSLSDRSSSQDASSTNVDNIKLTALVQWTSERFRVKILSHDANDLNTMKQSYMRSPKLRLIIDAEDLMASLDFQDVFLKFKGKIAAASIKHYVKRDGTWKPGPFLGVVMQVRDKTPDENALDADDFCTVTITRASCQHAYVMWGTSRKYKLNESQLDQDTKTTMPIRFMTEIVINLRPIDLIFSLITLRSYCLVLEPLINITKSTGTNAPSSTGNDNFLTHVNNQTLPLAYLDCTGIRIIIPSIEMGRTGEAENVVMFQIRSVNLMPVAVNPICRTPTRPDIYQKAAKKRILHIPGSEVEDRQYQLDVVGMSMNTGSWDEIRPVLLDEGQAVHNLKTMNENPALEWNNLDATGVPGNVPQINVLPVLSKHNVNVIVAPAIVFKSDVVCGHSIEINYVTDIDVSVTLSQIKLASALLDEFCDAFTPLLTTKCLRPKILFPYQESGTSLDQSDDKYYEDDDVTEDCSRSDAIKDSGIEMNDLLSDNTTKSKDTTAGIEYEKSLFKSTTTDKITKQFPKTPTLPSNWHNMPTDILLTAGKFKFILYDIRRPLPSSKPKKTTNILAQISKKAVGMLLQQSETDAVPNINMNNVFPSQDDFLQADEEQIIDDVNETKEKEVKDWKNEINYTPLVFLSVSQPNAFISKLQLGNTIQLSVFDVCAKMGTESCPINVLPTETDFPVVLLETKLGQLNPDNGIPPAFFTLKLSEGFGKTTGLEIVFGRPTRVLCSLKRWTYANAIKRQIVESFAGGIKTEKRNKVIESNDASTNVESSVQSGAKPKPIDSFVKYKEIKGRLCGVTNVKVKSAQLVACQQTDDEAEVSLSIGGTCFELCVHQKPETITTNVKFDAVTLSVHRNNVTRLLINPWSSVVKVSLVWDLWQSVHSDPQIRVSIDSDPLMIDVGPEHIKGIAIILKECAEIAATFPSKETRPKPTTVNKDVVVEKEQHYKDDLRAGAFQFVDSIGGEDELPQRYQVKFWNKSFSAMAWRYPQPRALTKVRVFPVPFKIVSQCASKQQVLCYLEYYSECHDAYQSYAQFYLSETDMSHLELPQTNPQRAIACTWRVVMVNANVDDDKPAVIDSPRVLVACMRIDSYFNKSLVPNLTGILNVSCINVSLYNYYARAVTVAMPQPLRPYKIECAVPENQRFLTFSLESGKAFVACWRNKSLVMDVTTTVRSSILDYAYLTMEPCVLPFTIKIDCCVSDVVSVNAVTKPIRVRFGPAMGHTLAVSAQMWNRPTTNVDVPELIIMTRYVICNDTNVTLRFGQAATDEDIVLASKYCHLYCWRSQKRTTSNDGKNDRLRISVEHTSWSWSKPFAIDVEGTQTLEMPGHKNLYLVIVVTKLSSTQKRVTFSGQLYIANMLREHFEMKLVLATAQNKDLEFKTTESHVVSGNGCSPSMLINTKDKFFLRLRFYGLEAAWSGDIPLQENAKCLQPWLVKVPLQERGQFLSIWCRVVKQQMPNNDTKILVMLWPLFMIRSHLPVGLKVIMETPKLKLYLTSKVAGRGVLQQLYCPGTIDLSHHLSFELESGVPTPDTYVVLHYDRVNETEFFKKSDSEDIDDILDVLKDHSDSKWPYLGEEFDNIDWLIEEQPVTHVQVRYKNACKYSSALCLELLPWCLMINTLGCPIMLVVNGQELCRLSHNSIISPPKVEETFHIGVEFDGKLCLSSPLQLAKSESSQSFFMPKIIGLIPTCGNVKTSVRSGSQICVLSIDSNMYNEIRTIKVASSHILTNHMPMQLQVVCFAVAQTNCDVRIPDDAAQFSFTIGPFTNKMKAGVSVIQWYAVANVDTNADFALYLSLALHDFFGWSSPVRVDKGLLRKSIFIPGGSQSIPTVVTLQEHKGQTFLGLHHDSHPQLLLRNFSGEKLFFAQATNEEGRNVVRDCEHFAWVCSVDKSCESFYTMPVVSEKFPDITPNGNGEYFVVAVSTEDDTHYDWSSPICTTNRNDQFVRVPYYGEVKVSVHSSSRTIIVDIESASQVEICARDIRVRLSHASGTETTNATIQQDDGSRKTDCSNKPSSSTTESLLNSCYGSADSSSISSTSSQTVATGTRKWHTKFEQMPTLTETSTTNVRNVASKSHTIERMSVDVATPSPKTVNVQAFIYSLSVTLTNDLKNDNEDVGALTCDNVAITAAKTEKLRLRCSASDVQFDNKLDTTEIYDYPVVLVNQEANCCKEITCNLKSNIDVLITNARRKAIVATTVDVEYWNDPLRNEYVSDIREVRVDIGPLSAYVEDKYVTTVVDYVDLYAPQNLVLPIGRDIKTQYDSTSALVSVGDPILWQSSVVSNPLSLRTLTIEPVYVCLSVHSSLKMYIALDQSPLTFNRFDRRQLLTTPYKLGHALTVHFLSGAIFRAGWVVGSLELLGSPGGLARAMGSGLRDFINLPYRGLVQSPWAFLIGITHGSASLMRHITAGTLHSMTQFASSVARNLDRLSLDEEHLRRTEEQRRTRPHGLAEGLWQGLSGFGVSLLGAVGGIAHHPMQRAIAQGVTPGGLAAGFGLGIVGVFIKPLGGAAEFLASTGQGLLEGAGWQTLPSPRSVTTASRSSDSNDNSILKYRWKYCSARDTDVFFATSATFINVSTGCFEAVELVLTSASLIIVNTDDDLAQRIISLSQIDVVGNVCDPTVLCFKFLPVLPVVKSDDASIDMDPVSRARVADYVKNTVLLVRLPSAELSPVRSETSVTSSRNSSRPESPPTSESMLVFHVSPQYRDYFFNFLRLLKHQLERSNFSVL